MDPAARMHLKERLLGEVEQLLTEGDRAYLQGLSRAAFIEALENELRFLGLYSHGDQETPAVIHALVEEHIDQWRMHYALQQENGLSSAPQPTPASRMEIQSSPFVQSIISSAPGILFGEGTHYIGFTPTLDRARIQVGHVGTGEERP